jgi:hypothetical protein
LATIGNIASLVGKGLGASKKNEKLDESKQFKIQNYQFKIKDNQMVLEPHLIEDH